MYSDRGIFGAFFGAQICDDTTSEVDDDINPLTGEI
jgi:hypothetical protein